MERRGITPDIMRGWQRLYVWLSHAPCVKRRQDEAPVLAVDLHFDLAVWILVGRFQDLAGDGERLGRVVSAPA